MTVGERIAARRKELNMTQEELAKKLGYKSRSSINKIELSWSDVPLSKLEKVASALDCDASYLMGWEDKPKLIIPKDFIQFFAEPEPQSELEKQISEACAILEEMPPDLRSRALAAIKALAQPPQSPDARGGSD